MKALLFSPLAQNDIDRIWDYTVTEWGLTQAETYIRDIQKDCEQLANSHAVGRKVDVREGYLKYPTGSHFIYYRITNTQIEVIRILHSAMDVERHL